MSSNLQGGGTQNRLSFTWEKIYKEALDKKCQFRKLQCSQKCISQLIFNHRRTDSESAANRVTSQHQRQGKLSTAQCLLTTITHTHTHTRQQVSAGK